MNIQKIYSVKINNSIFTNKVVNTSQPKTGISMNQPLKCDTISFQGRNVKIVSQEAKAAIARKEARAIRDARQISEAKRTPDKTAPTKKTLSGEERKRGVSKSTAARIRNMILAPQEQIHEFIDRIFGDLKVTEISPKNLILDMSDNAKSVNSIVEKSATRDLNSIEEVFEGRIDLDGKRVEGITDLNRCKIVMNFKTGKAETESALSRLIPLIKTGQITLHEAELQRPGAIEPKSMSLKSIFNKEQEEFDYVSRDFLDKLEDAQEEVWNGLETNPDKIKLISRPLPKYTKFNYCALHLILEINKKGAKPFEMQIMGAREAKGKVFDDKRFKKFDGKELDKIYNPLVQLWQPLMLKENEAAKEEFFRYCKDANLQLRKDEIQENLTQRLINRSTGFFKSVREYKLPPEYDLNEQYKLMLKCESKKPTTPEVKEKSPKSPKEQEKEPSLTREASNKFLQLTSLKKGQKIKIRIF